MASARDGIDVLLRDRGLRKTTPDVAAESLLRGAWASAVLAGTTSDEAAFRRGRRRRRRAGLAAAVDPRPRTHRGAHPLAVAGAGASARVAAADEPPDTVGRPRDADSARRLADVAALLSRPTTAPGLVVAAVVHAEILSAQPFATHNGLVARAAERLILLERGVDRLAPPSRRPGTWPPGRRTRRASRRTPRPRPRGTRAVGSRRRTPGCCTPPRPTRPGPTTARCCADTRAPAASDPRPRRTSERHPPEGSAAAGTRKAGYQACTQCVASG